MNRRNFFSRTIAAIGAILVGPYVPTWTVEIGPTILSQGCLDINASLVANMVREI